MVQVSDAAVADLLDRVERLTEFSSAAAARLIDAFELVLSQLRQFPESGQRTKAPGFACYVRARICSSTRCCRTACSSRGSSMGAHCKHFPDRKQRRCLPPHCHSSPPALTQYLGCEHRPRCHAYAARHHPHAGRYAGHPGREKGARRPEGCRGRRDRPPGPERAPAP